LRHDAPLLAEQPVEEARLPDVRPADDREPRLVEVRRRLGPLRQQLDDTVEQVAGPTPVERGDPHRLTEPQSVEPCYLRQVAGIPCAIAARRPNKRLTRVDLPTFWRPTTAIFGTLMERAPARVGGSGRSPSEGWRRRRGSPYRSRPPPAVAWAGWCVRPAGRVPRARLRCRPSERGSARGRVARSASP